MPWACSVTLGKSHRSSGLGLLMNDTQKETYAQPISSHLWGGGWKRQKSSSNRLKPKSHSLGHKVEKPRSRAGFRHGWVQGSGDVPSTQFISSFCLCFSL